MKHLLFTDHVWASGYTSLIHVKIAHITSVYGTYCLGNWNEENERKNKIKKILSLEWIL